jgi:hypothetical protein
MLPNERVVPADTSPELDDEQRGGREQPEVAMGGEGVLGNDVVVLADDDLAAEAQRLRRLGLGVDCYGNRRLRREVTETPGRSSGTRSA